MTKGLFIDALSKVDPDLIGNIDDIPAKEAVKPKKRLLYALIPAAAIITAAVVATFLVLRYNNASGFPVDEGSFFVGDNYSEVSGAKEEPEPSEVYGLIFSRRDGKYVFRLDGCGMTYSISDDGKTLELSARNYTEAEYYPQPAGGCVINPGIFRRTAEGVTKRIIQTEGIVTGVVLKGERLYFCEKGSGNGPDLTLKYADLEAKRVYTVAEFYSENGNGGQVGGMICGYGDGVVLTCSGALYAVGTDGKSRKIAENVKEYAVEGDKIYVLNGKQIDVYGAGAEVQNEIAFPDRFTLLTTRSVKHYASTSSFTVYNGKVAGVTDGKIALFGTDGGSPEILTEAEYDYYYASVSDGKLMICGSNKGGVYSHETPTLYGITVFDGDERLFRKDFEEAKILQASSENRYFETLEEASGISAVLFPSLETALRKAEIKEVWCAESVRRYELDGQVREFGRDLYADMLYIRGVFRGKEFLVNVCNTYASGDSPFCERIGIGRVVIDPLLSSDSLPLEVSHSEEQGRFYNDLVFDGGEPRGFMSWTYNNGVESLWMRMLFENGDSEVVAELVSELSGIPYDPTPGLGVLTPEEAKELLG